MDTPVLADQQELIHISCVRTLDVVWRSCQEQWMIRTDGEREKERESQGNVLSTGLDDDDDEIYNNRKSNLHNKNVIL